jgi:hypothetical protein
MDKSLAMYFLVLREKLRTEKQNNSQYTYPMCKSEVEAEERRKSTFEACTKGIREINGIFKKHGLNELLPKPQEDSVYVCEKW